MMSKPLRARGGAHLLFLLLAGMALAFTDAAQQTNCEARTRFLASLPAGFRPDTVNEVEQRLLRDYGAVLVARGGATPPPMMVFPDETTVARFQSNIRKEKERIGSVLVELQAPAMKALREARVEAKKKGLKITPRGSNSSGRTYAATVRLWKSRVEPGLRHWARKRRLTRPQENAIRSLDTPRQVAEILRLEKEGLFFNSNFSRSIMCSVAPPGASQHLSLLAFDIQEHDAQAVRDMLARHGWFQTIQCDAPHFTYLGVEERELPWLGLRRVVTAGREFWLPALDCQD